MTSPLNTRKIDHPKTRLGRRKPSRRGMALAITLVLIVITMMISAALLQTVLRQYRQTRTLEAQGQAIWLAESGMQRALHRLAQTPDYEGESWQISAELLSNGESGYVKIEVQDLSADSDEQGSGGGSSDGGAVEKHIVVEAVYPDHPHRRVLERREHDVTVGS